MAILLRNHTDTCIELDLRDGGRVTIAPHGTSPALLVEQTYGNTHLPGWLDRKVVSRIEVPRSYAEACDKALRVLARDGRPYQPVLAEFCQDPLIDEREAWELLARGITDVDEAKKIVHAKRPKAAVAKQEATPAKASKPSPKKPNKKARR